MSARIREVNLDLAGLVKLDVGLLGHEGNVAGRDDHGDGGAGSITAGVDGLSLRRS